MQAPPPSASASADASVEPVLEAPSSSMAVTAWVTILAPLVAIVLEMASIGWLSVIIILWSPLWLAGYALLVVCVARGMLRRRGVLRSGARRVRAKVWAWLTSIGVVLVGLALIDGGDTAESVQSTLTLLLGSPQSPSPAHAASEVITLIGVAGWLIGWLALIVEWIVGAQLRRREAPRVAPPVVPPPVVP